MVIKKETKKENVYRGICLYESELNLIINSLKKAKLDGSKELSSYLSTAMTEAKEEL